MVEDLTAGLVEPPNLSLLRMDSESSAVRADVAYSTVAVGLLAST